MDWRIPNTFPSSAHSTGTAMITQHDVQGQDTELTSVTCEYCNASFTGIHGKGNRTRHVKHKHRDQNLNSSLQCPQCHVVLNRSDAKKLHILRKHSNTSTMDSPVNMMNLIVSQKDYSSQHTPNNIVAPSISELSAEAYYLAKSDKETRQVIKHMQLYLSPDVIADRMGVIEVVVGHMTGRAPNDDITRAFLQAQYRLRQHSGYGGSHEQSTSLSSMTPSSVGSFLADSSQNDHVHIAGLQNTPLLAKERTRAKQQLLHFACHVSKYNTIHGLPQICASAGFANMSELQQHLNRQDHQHIVRGPLSLCRTCYRHFRTETCLNVHDLPQDQYPRQPRGRAQAAQWIAVYRLIFPGSLPIPSPFVDDDTNVEGSNHLTSPIRSATTTHNVTSFQTNEYQPNQGDPAERYGLLGTQTLSQLAASSTIVQLLVGMMSDGSEAFYVFIRRQLDLAAPLTLEQREAVVGHVVTLYHQQHQRIIAAIHSAPIASPSSNGYLDSTPRSTFSHTNSHASSSASPYTYSSTPQYETPIDTNDTPDSAYAFGPSPSQGPFHDSFYTPRYPG